METVKEVFVFNFWWFKIHHERSINLLPCCLWDTEGSWVYFVKGQGSTLALSCHMRWPSFPSIKTSLHLTSYYLILVVLWRTTLQLEKTTLSEELPHHNCRPVQTPREPFLSLKIGNVVSQNLLMQSAFPSLWNLCVTGVEMHTMCTHTAAWRSIYSCFLKGKLLNEKAKSAGFHI